LGKRNAAGNDSSSGSEEHGKARWGIGLTDMTPEIRQQMRIEDDVHGAVVGRVQPGSPADNAGLSRGDVILQVNRQNVQSAADVQRALANVPKGQDALLLVWSRGGNTFRVLHSSDAA
jgi:serine protease Do